MRFVVALCESDRSAFCGCRTPQSTRTSDFSAHFNRIDLCGGICRGVTQPRTYNESPLRTVRHLCWHVSLGVHVYVYQQLCSHSDEIQRPSESLVLLCVWWLQQKREIVCENSSTRFGTRFVVRCHYTPV